MSSLKRREGYLIVDNSNGPGVSEEQLAKLPRKSSLVAVPEGKRLEAATHLCKHCQAIVILNKERKRERSSCAKCGYLCDACGFLYGRDRVCRDMNRRLDELQEQAFRREQAGLPPGEILIK